MDDLVPLLTVRVGIGRGTNPMVGQTWGTLFVLDVPNQGTQLVFRSDDLTADGSPLIHTRLSWPSSARAVPWKVGQVHGGRITLSGQDWMFFEDLAVAEQVAVYL